jgi:cytochrome c-type biogenesis protein CcmH/NrfG
VLVEVAASVVELSSAVASKEEADSVVVLVAVLMLVLVALVVLGLLLAYWQPGAPR